MRWGSCEECCVWDCTLSLSGPSAVRMRVASMIHAYAAVLGVASVSVTT
jgi:hypothetical protein